MNCEQGERRRTKKDRGDASRRRRREICIAESEREKWMETRGKERQRDEKEDLEVSDLPSTKPKGIYEMRDSIYKVRDGQMEED